jgi:sugar phosphate isomerase/epimerase
MNWILSAFADEAADGAEGQIAALLEAGIDHIDVRNADGHNISNMPEDYARTMARKLEAAGIRVCMFGSPVGKIDIADDFEIDVQKMRHLGRMKQIFNADKVRIFSYWNKKGPAEEAVWRKVALERLHRLSDLAGELGLVLYHENELGIFGDYVRRVAILRDEIHAKHPGQFKLIFDFDNFNQCGEPVADAWAKLGPAIEAIHLKESRKGPDGTFQHVPAGQGDGRIPQVLADLAARGWNGPLTLEPHLARSAGVVATGAHGMPNQSLKDLTPAQCFQIAAKAAKELLRQVGRLGN